MGRRIGGFGYRPWYRRLGISPLLLAGALLVGVLTGSLVTLGLRGPEDASGVGAFGDERVTSPDTTVAVQAPERPVEEAPTEVGAVRIDTERAARTISPPAAGAVGTVPAWRRYALAAPATEGRPMIALVIDDVGIDRGRSRQMVELPGPLTISFLSYANDLPKQAEAARVAGHELLVHVSMGPHNPDADPGPGALLLEFSQAELQSRLKSALSQFPGYVGINNHMGSRFTENEAGMRTVMDVVRSRGLLFLDSRTSADSVAYKVAKDLDVPSVQRDVFLDHDPTPESVRAALAELEEIALRRGYAIGIGHPRDATIEVLREWLPLAAERGFALVPISTVVSAQAESG